MIKDRYFAPLTIANLVTSLSSLLFLYEAFFGESGVETVDIRLGKLFFAVFLVLVVHVISAIVIVRFLVGKLAKARVQKGDNLALLLAIIFPLTLWLLSIMILTWTN